MSHYRDILYRDYSAAFSAQKSYNPEQQFAQYAAVYDGLPKATDAAIADLGCGKGEWLAWLGTKGFTNLTGVDGSPADLAIARQHDRSGVQWIESDVTAHLATRPQAYDLIHAKDIIEHMTKDEFIRFLQAARLALKPGGRLWLLTFNAQSPLSAATRYGDFTHESGHTPSSLAQCLRACGFAGPRVRGLFHCARSFGGRMRSMLGAVFFPAGRLLLKLRHGSGASVAGVDLHTTLPDVFAEARVP